MFLHGPAKRVRFSLLIFFLDDVHLIPEATVQEPVPLQKIPCGLNLFRTREVSIMTSLRHPL